MKSKIYALLLLIILFGSLYTLPVDGTPFHKEDSKIDSTKIKDRLNLWPLVYVNQGNFSLLWPLLDVSDNYFALRPAFSVYNKNNGKKQISVIWPLCTLDFSKSKHHIFPFYWGKNRRVVFPLYWNKWNDADTEEYNTLIPLWYHHRLNDYSNLTVLPALFSYRKNGADKAWNWAILAGKSSWKNRRYSYILWPLHISKTDDDTNSSYQHTLPFYILTKNNRAKTLLTIPYSYSQQSDGSGWNRSLLHYYTYSQNHKKLLTLLYGKGETETPKQSWKYITPLYINTKNQERETNLLLPIIYWEKGFKRNLYATLLGGVSKQENMTSWFALPIASWGTKTDSNFSANMLGGIIHSSKTPEYRKHHILPAYYWNGEKDLFLSAVAMRWKRENSNLFVIPPLASWYSSNDYAKNLWLAAGLMRFGEVDGKSRSHILPIYYSDENRFLSVLYLNIKDGENDTRISPPLLSWIEGSPKVSDLYIIGGLAHYSWGEEAVSDHFVPFYYWHKKQKIFASLVYTSWHYKDTYTQMFPPALSWKTSSEDRSDLWLAGPIAHFSWGRTKGSTHFAPFYYSDKQRGIFASPIYAKWNYEDMKVTFIPPLISWKTVEKDKSDLYLAGPLAHFSWGNKAESDHVFPFYYWNKKQKSFISLAYTKWEDETGKIQFIPPLVSWKTVTKDKSDLYLIGPLAHFSWGKNANGDHIFPFYAWNKKQNRFISLPYSKWEDETSKTQFIPPLLSWKKSSEDKNDLHLVGSLAHFSWGDNAESDHIIPFYYWNKKQKSFISLPYSKWEDETSKTQFIPPLLSWKKSSVNKNDLHLVGSLAHFSWGDNAESDHIIPFYYWNKKQKSFISLPYSKWEDETSKTQLIPALLSWKKSSEDKNDLHLIASLAHFSWGKNAGSDHIIPFYYWNKQHKIFLSVPFMKWENEKSTTQFIPPLLSWKTTSQERKDLWLVGPIAHFSWGEKPNSHHVLPFYYYHIKSKTFLSALYSKTTSKNGTTHIYPPALSGYTKGENYLHITAFMGLGMLHKTKEIEKNYSYFMPLYASGNRYFYNPLFGWKNNDNGFVYFATPLLGAYKNSRKGSWLFPLYSYKKYLNSDIKSRFLLLGSYKKTATEKRLFFPLLLSSNWRTLPQYAVGSFSSRKHHFGVYISRHEKKITPAVVDRDSVLVQEQLDESASSLVIPFWKSTMKKNNSLFEKKKYVLGILYTSKESRIKLSKDKVDVKTESRVLWKLWHKRRENGNVSLDVFPAITYDKRENGDKKFSFLWRVYRYQKEGDSKKLDILFIPLMRK